MEWLDQIVGKTIAETRIVTPSDQLNDMEIEVKFTDKTILLLSSSGWSEGVTAEGSEILGELSKQ